MAAQEHRSTEHCTTMHDIAPSPVLRICIVSNTSFTFVSRTQGHSTSGDTQSWSRMSSRQCLEESGTAVAVVAWVQELRGGRLPSCLGLGINESWCYIIYWHHTPHRTPVRIWLVEVKLGTWTRPFQASRAGHAKCSSSIHMQAKGTICNNWIQIRWWERRRAGRFHCQHLWSNVSTSVSQKCSDSSVIP